MSDTSSHPVPPASPAPTVDAVALFNKHVFVCKKFANEFAVTINFNGIVNYYMDRIGLLPLMVMWEEIRALLIANVSRLKEHNVEKKPFVIRFIGGSVPVWLVLKVYALLVYEADGIYYCSDAVIKI